MKTKLVVTDLTRMYQGRICFAGYNDKQQCIRPVLPPPGIPEGNLYQNKKPIIFPFALIELDLEKSIPEPPHTEDMQYYPMSVRFVRTVINREEVLNWSLFDSAEEIFDQTVLEGPGYYVKACQGSRSLGTIRPSKVIKAIYESGEEGTWDYRLSFINSSNRDYRLKITDLTWHYYCDSLRSEHRNPKQIAYELTKKLRNTKVYLRIGLARGWKKFPDRCYLQITGIYTFPDYLDGKIFADFSDSPQ